MNTQQAITALAAYAVKTELITETDVLWAVNGLLRTMRLDAWEGTEEDVRREAASIDEARVADGSFLEEVLRVLLDDACARGVVENDSVAYRDLFDTELMGLLTARPSVTIDHFRRDYDRSPQLATDRFYRFSQDSDYIRRYRIRRDVKWQIMTEYGALDITINLSKPEKDPRAIAAALKSAASAYPKCQLCRENEGYAGRLNHPARENHRIIPVTLAGDAWGFQYSPYVYYNEHCIVLNNRHVPMKIDRGTFARLFDFVRQFPHYFVGSNADLPIVGGSILTHDHFQGGRYEFAMARAEVERSIPVPDGKGVRAGIVRWPMSVIRLSGEEPERMIDLADHILAKWRAYTDEAAFVLAETDGEPHNTITPIARRRGDSYELDLVLRNNLTTREHPLGVYHPHADLHHIKKENIGLIEVMGLAVLPARLNDEMAQIKEALAAGRGAADIAAEEHLAAHADWVGELMEKYGFAAHPERLKEENLGEILRAEIGSVFLRVLMDAGVFKRDEAGQQAFDRFAASL